MIVNRKRTLTVAIALVLVFLLCATPMAGAYGGTATFYEHIDGRGFAITQWGDGWYDMHSMGMPNDCISSIYVESGYEVVAYEHMGFGGQTRTYGPGWHNMTDDGFNDTISSYVIRSGGSGGGGGGDGGGGGSPGNYVSYVDLGGENRDLSFWFYANISGNYRLDVYRDGGYITSRYAYASAGGETWFGGFDPGYDHGYWNPSSAQWENWAHQTGNRLTLKLYNTDNNILIFSGGDWDLLGWGAIYV